MFCHEIRPTTSVRITFTKNENQQMCTMQYTPTDQPNDGWFIFRLSAVQKVMAADTEQKITPVFFSESQLQNIYNSQW